ncbi:MAG: hypothetical protein PCFJNLEI_02220 [Verrucomicrobiae bacterium]|nr:hypothetical protein [Verrucomicrobiae bacterium]
MQRLTGWRAPATDERGLPDCTLVVPTWKRPVPMAELVRALAQLPDPPAEVVVVDGSPDTATSDALRAVTGLPFELKYIRSPVGLTRQRNVGVDASTREFIFFLDDDCFPEPEYFRRLRQIFLDDRAGRIGAVRGFLINGVNLPVGAMWEWRARLGICGREPGKYYPTGMTWTWNGTKPFAGTRPIDVLAGGAVAYRRAVFAKHRFSEFFAGYSSGEDLEFSRRMAADWELVASGEARVDHRHAAGGRPGGFEFGRMAMRNRYFIWRRHSPQAGIGAWWKVKLDEMLILGRELGNVIRGPARGAAVARFLGRIWGSAECVVRPPRYEEPPARREYEFDLADSCKPVSTR